MSIKHHPIDRLLQEAVADAKVAGVVATACTREEILYEGAFGERVLGGGVPMTQLNLEPAPTGRPAGALMWAGLANSFYWIDPVTGVGGVYLTQMFPFADHESVPLYYAFESEVYKGLQERQRPEATRTPGLTA